MNAEFEPEFDRVYLIDAEGRITEPEGAPMPPDIWDDPRGDVSVEGEWDVLRGFTGQYGYRGAVMHPSEQWGEWAVAELTRLAAGSDDPVLFVVLEVPEADGRYPDGDPIGWVVAHRDRTEGGQ